MGENISASIGDHNARVVVGNDNTQTENNIYIQLGKDEKLDSFSEASSTDTTSQNSDWVTVVLVIVFVLFYVIAVAVPLAVYQFSGRNPAASDVQNWILALASTTSGVTGLIGVSVGYRLAKRR